MNKEPKHISRLVREAVQNLAAYYALPADGMIKLDAMENPYPMPAKLRKRWLSRLADVEVNRYPDPQCQSLKRVIRTTFQIADHHGLVLGNGSDELIQMIALLVGGPGRCGGVMLVPTPTFSMYQLIATATGSEFVGVPLRVEQGMFNLDGDALLDAIRQHQPVCVFLAWPNNPTGNCFDEAVITEVLEKAPGIVVLDEAYFAFCRRSFLSRLQQFPDLMVLRTLSKNGMAGLRLGMLIAHPLWAHQLEKIRLPYNINSLTQCSAQFYLEHHDIMQKQADKIIDQRKVVFEKLANLPGVHPYPSDANFILFKLEQDAKQIHDRLIGQGVLVKNLHHTDPLLHNHLRVTIGSKRENGRFLEALSKSLS